MSALFDSTFLHDGHIAVFSSSLFGFASVPDSVDGVDSTERGCVDADVSKMKCTGIKVFRLQGTARHEHQQSARRGVKRRT